MEVGDVGAETGDDHDEGRVLLHQELDGTGEGLDVPGKVGVLVCVAGLIPFLSIVDFRKIAHNSHRVLVKVVFLFSSLLKRG